jgi:hypothetical protein
LFLYHDANIGKGHKTPKKGFLDFAFSLTFVLVYLNESTMKNIGLLALIVSSFTLFSCDKSTDGDGVDGSTYNSSNNTISSPTVWESDETITVDCPLDVQSTLTIEPGCTIKFTSNGSLSVGVNGSASLIADGSTEQPIRFIPSSGTQAGSWGSITFGLHNVASLSKLNNCIIVGAGKSSTAGIVIQNTRVSMDSCTVEYSSGNGVQISGTASFNSFGFNNIRNCSNYSLEGEPQCLLNLDSTNLFGTDASKAISVLPGIISTTGNLTKQAVPYIIQDYIDVENELTIDEGCTLKFKTNAYLAVGQNHYAALIAEGTAEEPIVFTSAISTPQAGDWEGIIFYEQNASQRSILKYTTIEYAGKASGVFEAAIYSYSGFSLENSTIKNSLTHGVYFRENGNFTTCANNVISDCGNDPIHIFASKAHTIGTGNEITANASMGIYVEGEYISQNAQWKKQTVPFIINGVIYVSTTSGTAVLTIDPGCRIHFLHSASINILDNGSMIANGTVSDSIIFTSNATTPSAGDWDGIYFAEESNGGNMLNCCKISYAGNYSDYAIGIRTSNITVSNCYISNSEMHGIYISYNEPAYSPLLINNTFSDNAGSNIYYEE